MITLPAALISEKNKISNADPWLILAHIYIPDYPVNIYLARNNEDVTWNSNTYAAYPFELDDISEARKGESPSLSLRLGNVNQVLNAYLEQVNGAVGAVVTIAIVHAAHLAETTPAMSMEFSVTGATVDSRYVSFNLGAQNPFLRRVPTGRVLKNHCRWLFKGSDGRCGYAGAETACDKTLTRCRELSNSPRFGGFPGVGLTGLKLA